MSSFPNAFSWSKSRHENFKECQRRYYFQYYGSWGGWSAGADSRTREIYLLKQLKTRQMWKGDLVHRIIRSALEDFQLEGQFPAPGALAERLVAQMRQEFRDSRERKYRATSKVNALFEHEYGVPVPDHEWQRQRDEALKCLHHFFESDIFRELSRIGPDRLIEVDKDQPDQFKVDGTTIYVKLDLAYRRPEGKWVIVDWKTGGGSADDLQAACYTMYLAYAHGANVEETEVSEYRLLQPSAQVYPIDHARIEATKERIRTSASAMKSMLRDPHQNTAVESDFALIEDRRVCTRCNFQKVCPATAAKFVSAGPPH